MTGAVPASGESFTVFAVIDAHRLPTILAELSDLPLIRDHSPALAVQGNPAIPAPVQRLLLEDAASLWEQLRLPGELREWLSFPLLTDAGVLILRSVTDSDISRLQPVLDRALAPSFNLLRFGELQLLAVAVRDGEPAVGHYSFVEAVAFSPDNRLLATAGEDRRIRLWDVASGASRSGLGLAAAPGVPRFAPDARQLAIDDWLSQTTTLWPLAGEDTFVVPGTAQEWSPVGGNIAVVTRVGAESQAQVWAVAERVLVRSVPGDSALFLPGGQELLTSVPAAADGSTAATVRVWRVRRGLDQDPARLEIPGTAPVLHPGGELVLTHLPDGTARLWRLDSGEEVVRLQVQDPVQWREPGQISPDGRQALFPLEGKAAVWDMQRRTPLFELTGTGFGYSPDSSLIAGVTGGGLIGTDSQVMIVTRAGEPAGRLDGDTFAFSPDGRYLAAATNRTWFSGAQFPATLWSASAGRIVAAVAGSSPCFTPDGMVLATAFGDGRAALWDGRTGQQLRLLGDIRVIALEPLLSPHVIGETVAPGVAPAVERYVETQYPARAAPETAFDVTVLLRRDAHGLPADARPLSMLPTLDSEGRPTGAPAVLVRARPSAAFEAIGDTHAEMAVPADGEPSPITFRFRPRADARGPQEIALVFYQGPEVLGQLRLVIEVQQDADVGLPPLSATFRRAPAQRGQSPPADAVLTVTRTTCEGRDALAYSYQWLARGWPPVEAGHVQLQTSAADWAKRLYQQLSEFARPGSGRQAADDAAALDRIGENIHFELATPELGSFFAEFMPVGQSLLIYTNEPWIPWEIMKPWHDDLRAEDSDFLCGRLALARWYYSARGQATAPLIGVRRLGAVLSAGNLPAVLDEWRYLRSIPQTWPPITVAALQPPTTGQLLGMLTYGNVQLLHFATHGFAQSDGVRVAMVRVGRDELSVDDLVGTELADGIRSSVPLIFMNACHSARRSPGLTRTDGWPERFLEFGAGAFLGANFEVEDELAYLFACTFYDELRAGTPLGRAVRVARAKLREQAPGNSTWLAYSLYAHPNTVVRAID